MKILREGTERIVVSDTNTGDWIDISRFYTYVELTSLLEGLVSSYPKLAAVESIGQSHEGREI